MQSCFKKVRSYFGTVQNNPHGENTMRRGLIGLVAGVALIASIGIATAKEPLKLTDGQMDSVTAGGTNPTVSSAQTLANLVTISNNTLNNLLTISNNTLGFFNAFTAFAASTPAV
jgi:hypothetical protein